MGGGGDVGGEVDVGVEGDVLELPDHFHQMRSCMDPGRRKVLGIDIRLQGGKLVLLHLLMTVYLQRTFLQGFFYRGCLGFAGSGDKPLCS